MAAKYPHVDVGSLDELKSAMRKLDMTDFQKAVLLEVFSIQKGSTATYKQIAERIGNPRAYRAVGTVLRKNPFAPFVPCHRVIRSDGSVGNYSARGGRKAKLRLLKSEGALLRCSSSSAPCTSLSQSQT